MTRSRLLNKFRCEKKAKNKKQFFLCGLLLFLANFDIACYADDNTPYILSKSTGEMLRDINRATKKSFTGFQNSSINAKPDDFM